MYKDPVKKAAYDAAYYVKHRERRRAYFRARYQAERKDIQHYQNLLRRIKREDNLRDKER